MKGFVFYYQIFAIQMLKRKYFITFSICSQNILVKGFVFYYQIFAIQMLKRKYFITFSICSQNILVKGFVFYYQIFAIQMLKHDLFNFLFSFQFFMSNMVEENLGKFQVLNLFPNLYCINENFDIDQHNSSNSILGSRIRLHCSSQSLHVSFFHSVINVA